MGMCACSGKAKFQWCCGDSPPLTLRRDTLTRFRSENAVGLNPFYDEPDPSRAVASNSPPEIAVRLIARLGEFGCKVLDRIDRVFACRIWIRDGSTVDHVVVRIKRELYHLKPGPDHPTQSPPPRAIGVFYTNTPPRKTC